MRKHPHLLEISAWPWLEQLSRRDGRQVTLGDVTPAAWDEIAIAGCDCVYLMGVWRRSAVGRLIARTDPAHLQDYHRVLPGWQMNDVPGSPFSIQAYQPDERMGGWRGLEACRVALADRGIDLFLDFVPNHTGFDHEWIGTSPEFYVQGTLADYEANPTLYRPIETADGAGVRFIACGRDPFFPPWRDVAQLNYFNPATRQAMTGVLQTIAQHCDGVRCDMAMLVLNDVFAQTWPHRAGHGLETPLPEFWPEAIGRAPMTYLAEVYWDREFELQQQGFAFTYDKRLLDRLHGSDPEAVRAHLRAESAYHAKLARFLENHDEPRSLAHLGDRIRAAATLTFTLPGMRFFFDRQCDGAEVRAPVQLGRWPESARRADIWDFYTRLLKTIERPLFHDGEWRLLDVAPAGDATSNNLIAHRWARDGEAAVIVVNLSRESSQGLVCLDTLPPGDIFEFHDQLSDQSFQWSRSALNEGLYVRLDAGNAHLFVILGTAA